jgi:hypothetical protein
VPASKSTIRATMAHIARWTAGTAYPRGRRRVSPLAAAAVRSRRTTTTTTTLMALRPRTKRSSKAPTLLAASIQSDGTLYTHPELTENAEQTCRFMCGVFWTSSPLGNKARSMVGTFSAAPRDVILGRHPQAASGSLPGAGRPWHGRSTVRGAPGRHGLPQQRRKDPRIDDFQIRRNGNIHACAGTTGSRPCSGGAYRGQSSRGEADGEEATASLPGSRLAACKLQRPCFTTYGTYVCINCVCSRRAARHRITWTRDGRRVLHRADRDSLPILVETQETDNFKFRRDHLNATARRESQSSR